MIKYAIYFYTNWLHSNERKKSFKEKVFKKKRVHSKTNGQFDVCKCENCLLSLVLIV